MAFFPNGLLPQFTEFTGLHWTSSRATQNYGFAQHGFTFALQLQKLSLEPQKDCTKPVRNHQRCLMRVMMKVFSTQVQFGRFPWNWQTCIGCIGRCPSVWKSKHARDFSTISWSSLVCFPKSYDLPHVGIPNSRIVSQHTTWNVAERFGRHKSYSQHSTCIAHTA